MSSITKERKIHTIKIAAIYAIAILFIVFLTIVIIRAQDSNTNVPFIAKSLLTISTGTGEKNEDTENRWNVTVAQKDDIYIEIGKNEGYKDDEELASVVLENIKIVEKPELGEIKIYKPVTEGDEIYNYTEENQVTEKIEYTISNIVDMKKMQMSKTAGIIGISIYNNNLAKYISNEGEELVYDGTLLGKTGVEISKLKYKISFDIKIVTVSGKEYKSNVQLQLPLDKIIEEGKEITEVSEPKNIVFKRV